MKLTIIPADKAVYKNGVCYSDLIWEGTPIDVHALQWLDTTGWVEFNDGIPNQTIELLPDWANNAMAAWAVANTPKPPSPSTAEENKATASQKLYETDWATISDVSDSTKSNPYLTNVSEFLIYRNTVRQYAISPIAGNIDWPKVPTAQWSS